MPDTLSNRSDFSHAYFFARKPLHGFRFNQSFMRHSPPLLLLILILSGCAAVSPFKQTPPSPDSPYEDTRTSRLAEESESLQANAPAALPKPNERLNLARLVDLAQSNNRSTRLAWQQARAAAVATGLAASDYYPLLVVLASYGGGYLDFQTSGQDNVSGALAAANLVPGSATSLVNQATGTGTVLSSGLGDTYTNFLGGAGLRWLLFDFGARANRSRAAVGNQLAANLRFNNAHQKLTFAVTECYYQLQAAERKQEAARVSQTAAGKVLAAVQARFDRGLLTEPDLMRAREANAQADYDSVTASSLVEIARVNLATAVGIPPGTTFQTTPTDFRKLSGSLQKPLDDHIRSALRHRPDLLAQVAAVQAAEARLRAARAERLPTLALDAIAMYNQFSPSGNSALIINQVTQDFQNYGGFLTVQWPVFSGFADQNKVRLAETAKEAAKEEMQLLREQVVSEVWKAYVRAKNALSAREAASALETACQSSYDASLAGFERGITPVQETLIARSALARASALVAEADAAIAESVTALALSSGRL